LILDSNEFVFGIPGTKASCAQLMDRLDDLNVFVPLMVVQEVHRNLERMFGLGGAFFRLLYNRPNVTILWADPPEDLLLSYTAIGFAEEDAAIAASAELIGARYLISENRHFLQHREGLPFETIDAQTALALMV
jgi:hypothetical protein